MGLDLFPWPVMILSPPFPTLLPAQELPYLDGIN